MNRNRLAACLFISQSDLDESATNTPLQIHATHPLHTHTRTQPQQHIIMSVNCSKHRVINRLALVLLSMVVLELVLIGDQVQPVKAIKKKIYLKKLKKLLPLLALIKPKKKIILLPVSMRYTLARQVF